MLGLAERMVERIVHVCGSVDVRADIAPALDASHCSEAKLSHQMRALAKVFGQSAKARVGDDLQDGRQCLAASAGASLEPLLPNSS